MSGTLMHRHSDIIRRTAVRRGELTTVEGYAPLALPNNAEWKAHSVTLYGKSVQDGVPDPDNPVPIIGVEGKLRMSGQNLFEFNDTYLHGGAVNLSVDYDGRTLTGTAQASAVSRIYKNETIPYNNQQMTVSAMFTSIPRILIRLLDTEQNNISDTKALVGWTYNTYYLGFVSFSSASTFIHADTDIKYIQVGFVFMGATGSRQTISNIQLTLGDTPTPYTPYRSPLTMPIVPLNGILLAPSATDYTYIDSNGDKYVADTLEWLPQGVWRHTQRSGVRVFDGTEAINMYRQNIVTITYRVANVLSNGWYAYPAYCTHFVKTGTVLADIVGFAHLDAGASVAFRVSVDSGIDSTEAFKAWLAAQYAAGTPVTVLYQLAEPITTDYPALPMPLLPNGEDAYIDNIDGTTTIPYIKAEYYKEAI